MQCAGAASALYTPERLCYCERYELNLICPSVTVHDSTLDSKPGPCIYKKKKYHQI